MAIDKITIEVDLETANAYNTASPARQRKIQALLNLWLKDVATADPEKLKELMNTLSENASARGLTPEILDRLLKEA
jgi:hypothetical protein